MAESLRTAAGSPSAAFSLHNSTVRNIVHVTLGGSEVRIRVSNVFGKEPLVVGTAHIALRRQDASVEGSSDRPISWSRRSSVSIPAGAEVVSDPVPLLVKPQSDVAISLFFPNEPDIASASLHSSAFQTSYVGEGNQAMQSQFEIRQSIRSWYYLTSLEVSGEPQTAGTIVAFGDSITDGSNTQTDSNHRWPDLLAGRLLGSGKRFAVANEGIGGNRILHDGRGKSGPRFGRSALARFDRDVLAHPGVRYLIVLEGINDIGHPGSNAMPEEGVSPEDIIAGLRQMIVRAHEHGIRVFGATLTPFAVTTIPNYFSPEGERKRKAVNAWIRSSNEFDGIVDFERAVRDEAHPDQMRPEFDSGDHLHPNDAGMKAIAACIDLNLFR